MSNQDIHNDDDMTYGGGEQPKAESEVTEETQLLDGEKTKEELEAEAKAKVSEDSAENQEDVTVDIPEVKLDPSDAEPNMSVTKQFEVYSVADAKSKRYPLIVIGKPFSFLRKDSPAWSEMTSEMAEDEGLQEFIQKFFAGIGLTMGTSEIKDKGFFENWLHEDNADIRQQIRDDANDIRIGARRPNLREPNRRLTGKAARAQIGSILGNGINNTIPLPHTGLNVEFTARPDVDYLNLDLQMAEERNKLGHDTSGLIFQCSHFGLSERLFKFAVESITDINLLGWEDPAMDLSKLMPITELPILYWGMASTMYPNGYPLDLPCASGPLNCKHIERVNLNVNRIFWMNRSKLTLDQQKMLSAIKHKHSLADLETYKKQFANVSTYNFEVEINGAQATMHLGIPTIYEHIEAGRRWALEAARSVEEILQTDDPDPQRRLAYMQRVIDMSALREYSPWVKKVVFNDGRYVDDKDVSDIEFVLSQISRSDDEIVNRIFTEIQTFIERTTVAIIAIPNTSCPKCGVDQATTVSEEHPELVPLDIEKLFFELKDRRLQSQT